MTTFKKGDAVWVLWNDRYGYPQLHHRPGVITKRIHPTSFMVTFVANYEYQRDPCKWTLDRKGRQRHPSDLVPYDSEGVIAQHLRLLRKKWREETDPATVTAWEQNEVERKRISDQINQRLRPILARMMT